DAGAHHTYVFDEVDARVGGAVGLEIGRRLQRLAAHSQVIVVTHLAQVAAFADAHFVVAKESDGQVTTSGVRLLTDDQRAAELARMMGGASSSTKGIEHAQELLAQAAR
ncbi:DNA repair protein RecN, partial [Tessaracoccus lubricantis]